MKTRIYGDKINLNQEDVKKFWTSRIYKGNLNSVLLGNQKDDSQSLAKNDKEVNILFRLLPKIDNISILDIGCGVGRWVRNFKNNYHNSFYYTGIDFNENFIIDNNKEFADFSNIKFYGMSVNNIDFSKLENNYDLIIMGGVLAYINDNDLDVVYKSLSRFSSQFLYLREPISVIDGRLTLNNFYSDELQSSYSAIYRLPEEYENLINKYFCGYKIIETEFMLDSKLGARKETNAKYWFLKKNI